MKAVFFTWLVIIASLMLAHADKPVTENREWEVRVAEAILR